jgi:hypothetical protein
MLCLLVSLCHMSVCAFVWRKCKRNVEVLFTCNTREYCGHVTQSNKLKHMHSTHKQPQLQQSHFPTISTFDRIPRIYILWLTFVVDLPFVVFSWSLFIPFSLYLIVYYMCLYVCVYGESTKPYHPSVTFWSKTIRKKKIKSSYGVWIVFDVRKGSRASRYQICKRIPYHDV